VGRVSSVYPVAWLPVGGSFIVALMLTMLPLPEVAEAFRPDWLALAVIYWVLMLPRNIGIGVAWLAGLVLDVAQGTLLGQHALALCAVAFVTSKFHLLIRMFPLSQMTATVFALLSVYQFLLFWMNGVAGVTANAVSYWGPIVTGTILWPVLSIILSGIRLRPRTGS